jgi:outer membrane protein
MMEKLRDPKNVKTISLIFCAIFVIGCFTLALTSGGFGGNVASAASPSNSAIGVVNYQMLVSQSPSLASVRTTMQTEIQNTKQEFEEKSKDMNATEKDRYYKQLQERLGNKEKELMDPLMKDIETAIKKVADKKGLTVVVDKNAVIYGGVDITDEVSKAMVSGGK